MSVLNPTLRHFYTDHTRADLSYRGPSAWRRAIKKLLLKRYEQVWCVSEFVRNCLMEQNLVQLAMLPAFHQYQSLSARFTVRAAMRRQHGVEDRFVITVIAQLIPSKGVDLAIHAAQLPEKAILWIVGSGAQADELQALAKTLDRKTGTLLGLGNGTSSHCCRRRLLLCCRRAGKRRRVWLCGSPGSWAPGGGESYRRDSRIPGRES